ncbi:MAG TPA: magnesium transporter [Candidatus Paceibacterota bacterium]|nr:magnesium transporter [Candidatus Paceibacterota bacterium]
MPDIKIPQSDLASVVHRISFYPHERVKIFLGLSQKDRAMVVLRLSTNIKREILKNLKDEEVVAILEHLDPDVATDIVQLLSKYRQKSIIARLKEEFRESVSFLAKFDPLTAAGLMDLDFVKAENTDTFSKVAKQFKVHEKRTGRLPVVVVMKDGKISGYLPIHELGFAKPEETIDLYVRKLLIVKHDASYEEVLKIFSNHPHNKVGVIGEDQNIIGFIYSDDLLRIEKKQAAASLYDFAGVNTEESVGDSVKQKVKNRYRWLILNLATAFFAAFTVSLFEDTISKYVLLAVYMPIVAGMGGNAGTQSLAVVVRGIALKQIDLKNAWVVLKREMEAGVINGFINGIAVAVIVYIINRDLKLALVLSMAMVVALFVAGFFGTLVPLIMKKIGKDPATSATIFITTATDVLGFLAFLGFAALILP